MTSPTKPYKDSNDSPNNFSHLYEFRWSAVLIVVMHIVCCNLAVQTKCSPLNFPATAVNRGMSPIVKFAFPETAFPLSMTDERYRFTALTTK